jgi:hypothetical protein
MGCGEGVLCDSLSTAHIAEFEGVWGNLVKFRQII